MNGFLKKIFLSLVIFGLDLEVACAFEGARKFENYLNSLKTLSGNFTQVNSKGGVQTGQIQISRPGKMRLTYNPPSSLLIVADGKWLITYDKDADQVDYVSLENTPAAFILSPQVRFSGDVEVTNIISKGTKTEVSLIRKDEPDSGYITLVFEDDPMALKEWSVVDPQGITTRVILSQVQQDIPLSPALFKIQNPSLLQQIF